jgi:gas vesicle protein
MKTSWVFCAGLTGLAAGVFLALAFAPQSGKETQTLVKRKTRQGLNRLAAGGKMVGEELLDLADQGKDLAARGKEQLSDALEAGRGAYGDAVRRAGRA